MPIGCLNSALTVVLELLKTFSWQELRQHPWRNAAAVVAVMLGVALAFSVHLINASALEEFSQAARALSGQSDLELRAVQGSVDENLLPQLAQQRAVAIASPMLELSSYALASDGRRSALRVIGIDPLLVAGLLPELMPQPFDAAARMTVFAPGGVFLNASARQKFAPAPATAAGSAPSIALQVGLQLQTLQVVGSVAAAGAPLAVMDIGAAQELFGRQGWLSRIDLQLHPGVDRQAFVRQLQSSSRWNSNLKLAEPEAAQMQLSDLSRAYRVNLGVLALIALFTGSFLVFSVLSLSVAKRSQQFALLGVLGLSARQRLALVLWESVFLGLLGSLLGLTLGSALATLALQLLGGDLGGGFFAASNPRLHWSPSAALVYGALGVLAALLGGYWPGRQVQTLPLAQALKGLGSTLARAHSHWIGLALLLLALLAATLPPINGLPIAAYVSVGLLLVGGISVLPWLIALLLDRLAPLAERSPLALLALERTRRQRETAAVTIGGIVASLSLAVALTVMVQSFRDSVRSWLEQVLPADIYLRSARSMSANETVFFDPQFVQAVARLDGIARVQSQRITALTLEPTRPAVALIARNLSSAAQDLPLVGAARSVPNGQIGIFVSEAMVDLYAARPGSTYPVLSAAFAHALPMGQAVPVFFVAGVWRDYARQTGSIVMAREVFERLSGDRRVNDLALWLAPGHHSADVQAALQALGRRFGGATADLFEVGSAANIRATSLRVFDRSFAITYWLQAVAIGIGLFGVAASFSAQVLSRRKEFGLLSHLGLTRGQILRVVTLESAAWTAVGSVAGLGLGLAVSVVLVRVINPQSFHWSMDLSLPWTRLLALSLALLTAGTSTGWLAGRLAVSRDAVLAVKEDW